MWSSVFRVYTACRFFVLFLSTSFVINVILFALDRSVLVIFRINVTINIIMSTFQVTVMCKYIYNVYISYCYRVENFTMSRCRRGLAFTVIILTPSWNQSTMLISNIRMCHSCLHKTAFDRVICNIIPHNRIRVESIDPCENISFI